MAVPRYGVLRGRAAERASKPDSPALEIAIAAGDQRFGTAINIRSTAADDELLYAYDADFQHDILRNLLGRPAGFTPMTHRRGALDYVRGHLFETCRMRPVPVDAGADNDLAAVLDATLERAIRDQNSSVFVFGSLFDDRMRDVHMNQGNRAERGRENATWQDGALLVYFPAADRWNAFFLAFESQAFKTDEHGNPVADSSVPHAQRRRRDRDVHPMAPLGISLSPMEVSNGVHRAPGETFVSTELPPPTRRLLRAYAFDPSRGRVLGNEMQISIPYRRLAKGPVEIDSDHTSRLAVIDYDASVGKYYKPVDLDDHRILLSNGLWPSESDPRFHQQMVYAVARETIEHFESALGRKIHWRRADRSADPDPGGFKDDDILTLNLFPHAMRAANAFYSPEHHGVLFGYFAADRDNSVTSLPNQPIFTCLSHDVIVHEMTHAIIDGQRGYFIEATNRDVPAFHEGVADLAALFRHFTHREVLLDTLQRTGGRLYDYQLRPDATSDAGAAPVDLSTRTDGKNVEITSQIAKSNPLIDLAQQFGDATGMRHALRKALGTRPTPAAYKSVNEPHSRGSILVAAVFDAFFSIYIKRTSDLFAIFRAGGGPANPIDLPGPLANQLCDVVNRTAEEFFALCIRALDYCPPIDVTFGEYLRAMITSDVDRDPDDSSGIRDALMQAFRLRGIFPDGARFFSEEALCWTRGSDLGLPDIAALHFGDPNALTAADRQRIAPALYGYLEDPLVRSRLGLDKDLPVDMPSFHPVFRTRNGSLQRDMIVEVVQTRTVAFDHDPKSSYPFRAGTTLIIEPNRATGTPAGARVRWVVTKPMLDPSKKEGEAAERHVRQQAYLAHRQLAGEIKGKQLHVDFAAVHGGL